MHLRWTECTGTHKKSGLFYNNNLYIYLRIANIHIQIHCNNYVDAFNLSSVNCTNFHFSHATEIPYYLCINKCKRLIQSGFSTTIYGHLSNGRFNFAARSTFDALTACREVFE